jgi:hypothetical protein
MIEEVPSDEPDEDEQFDVVALVEPEPVLERVPVPVQSVALDRSSEASMEPAIVVLDASCVP